MNIFYFFAGAVFGAVLAEITVRFLKWQKKKRDREWELTRARWRMEER